MSVIHMYWHEPSDQLEALRARWAQINDTAVRLWTAQDLPELTARTTATTGRVHGPDRPRHFGNVARWALLQEYGGVWVDADVAPRRSLGELLDRPEPWCASIRNVPTPFVCGGPAGHDLWKRTLLAALDDPEGTSPEASGGRLLQRVATPDELRLVPAALFASCDAAGRPLAPVDGGRFCEHDWTTSRRRYAGDQR